MDVARYSQLVGIDEEDAAKAIKREIIRETKSRG